MKSFSRCCFAVLLLAAVCTGTACTGTLHMGTSGSHHKHGSQWKGLSQVVAVMHPTAGNKAGGTVVFTQTKDGVKVEANITGLSPDSQHAIHVHQYGDVRRLHLPVPSKDLTAKYLVLYLRACSLSC